MNEWVLGSGFVAAVSGFVLMWLAISSDHSLLASLGGVLFGGGVVFGVVQH